MKIKCRFIQRNESYEGEYAPELLVAVDEFTNDANPEWFEDEAEKGMRLVKGDISGYTDAWIDLGSDAINIIRQRCLGTGKDLEAKIV